MSDSLRDFQFPKSKGLFVTFDDGDEYKLRILTTDPVVTQKEFTNAEGETNISTRFAFIVYNFTLERAQVLNAGATITKAIQKIHQDPDFGANIKDVDIKVTATGSKLSRKYNVQVLPKAETMSAEQIAQAREIKLDEVVEGGERMSFYKPESTKEEQESGYEQAKKMRDVLKADDVAEVPEEPINLDDIPF